MRYTTTSLADHIGVHPNTLKLWEDQGIIAEPERDSVGRRIYSQEEADEIKRIAEQRMEYYRRQQAGR